MAMRHDAAFIIHADARELAELRKGVRELVGEDGELNRDLLLAIHELVTNAILHGRGAGNVVVCIAVDRDRVTATVADAGRGFDVGGLLRRWPPPLDEERGRGIYLVTRLMDSVNIDSASGTIVHMSRERNAGGDRTNPICVWATPTHARFSHPWLLGRRDDALPWAS